MGELATDLALYFRLIGARLRGQMQYRTSFVLQFIGNFAINGIELSVIFILFQHFETLGGWTRGEIAFLYGLSAFSFGIAHMVSGGVHTFSQQIKLGSFDRVLTRPVGAFLQVLAADLQLQRLGRSLQGLVAFVIALRLVDVPWDAGRVLYMPVVILSAVILFTALFTLEATMCFWTTESTEVINAFTFGGTTLAQYPIHVFDTWLRRLFLYAVPVGLIIFMPSLYFLDKPNPLALPDAARFAAPFAALGFAVVAGALWRHGVRHYRSAGG